MAVCMFALFAISSCKKDIDTLSNENAANREHLQKMKDLCVQYGWRQIDGVSQKEVDKFLLSEDYEKTKEFFELMKTGGETIDLTDHRQNTQQARASAWWNEPRVTYTLRGEHGFYLASSTTEMVVKYDREALDVISTKVYSNPSCAWIPNPRRRPFYFKDNTCNIVITGRVKWGFIQRDMKMEAYITLGRYLEEVLEGKIYSFRANDTPGK